MPLFGLAVVVESGLAGVRAVDFVTIPLGWNDDSVLYECCLIY